MATYQNMPIRKIAISTGGGDAPGLNAVIRAAALSAHTRGWEVYGVRDGFHGLLLPEEYPDGGLIPLTRERVSGIISRLDHHGVDQLFDGKRLAWIEEDLGATDL